MAKEDLWGDLWTDATLDELTDDLKGIYKQATEELADKASDYFEEYKDRWMEQYHAWQDGVYTDQQFREWEMAQFGRGKRWEELSDDMARSMTNANIIATEYMNGVFPLIYAENYNHSAYIIEQAVSAIGEEYNYIDFNLLDANTVKRLSASRELTMLPPKARLDPKKDVPWNKRTLQNSLLQGILQGESIDKMAARLARDVGHMNTVQAIRAARTMCTEAQNAGRLQNYREAEALGIDMLKEWVSTADDRTRESHAEMDGVRVKVKDLFPNHLECPGDHRGEPAEVYNCRCTMRAVFPKYKTGKEKRYSAVPGHEGYHNIQTYDEWKENKLFEISENANDYSDDYSDNKTFTPPKNVAKIKTRLHEYENGKIHVSRNVRISDKELKNIDELISSSVNLLGVNNSDYPPQIVLVNKNELMKRNGKTRNGCYDPISNSIYISVESFSYPHEEGYMMPNDPRRILVHELVHWSISEEFMAKKGKISILNLWNHEDYELDYAEKFLDKHSDIDPLLVSKHARIKYNSGDVIEPAVEMNTMMILRGIL